MPSKRKPENAGLPTGWISKHGAYYYKPPVDLRPRWDGKSWFRLGTTLPEAYAVWAERIAAPKTANTFNELFDQYLIDPEGLTAKKPKTRTEYRKYIEKLRPPFGGMRVTDLEPQHVYAYVKARSAKVSAKREVECLSAMITKAVSWGVLRANPLLGQVKLTGSKTRDRYVEDWELIEMLSLIPHRHKGSLGMVQAYLRLKLLTGLRQRDLLLLTVSDLTDEGVRLATSKNGKKVVYIWTPELRTAVDAAKQMRPALSPYLFCNRFGGCLVNLESGTASSFGTLWHNAMKRVLKETKVTERFTEHDLRAKVGSDAESLERARQLLTHADSKITERVYRRKPERIAPAKVST